MTNNNLNDIPDNQLSLTDRKALIARHPLFILLNDNHLENLASIAHEIDIPAGSRITTEGHIVDSIYLIASGTADVSRTVTTVEKSEVLHIATLTKTQAIGIGDAGLYSQTGIRTATVIASTPMVLLKITLKEFQEFLKQPGVIYPGLRRMVEYTLLMNFIQTTHTFGSFSTRQIQRLSKMIKKIVLPAGIVLYKQGDKANQCFYILSGEVALTSENQPEKILGYSTIVGDEIFHHSNYAATAETKTNCELFVLEASQLPAKKAAASFWFQSFIKKILKRLKM